MINTLNCPVSADKVNENAVRTASFLTIVFLLSGLLLKSYLLVWLLAFDFGLRAFTSGKYSFISSISKRITNFSGIKEKLIDAAQKKFAAAIGMAFLVVIGIFIYSENLFSAYISAAVLISFSLLEGIFAFCAGCYIYSWIQKIKSARRIYGISKNT